MPNLDANNDGIIDDTVDTDGDGLYEFCLIQMILLLVHQETCKENLNCSLMVVMIMLKIQMLCPDGVKPL